MKSLRLRQCTETVLFSLLSFGLSWIRIVEMPLGGSLTLLCMLPVCLLSLRWGIGWGVCGGFLFGVLRAASDLPGILEQYSSPEAVIGCLMLSYAAAFSAVGLAGLFRKHGIAGTVAGVFLAVFLRFACHSLFGALAGTGIPEGWTSGWLYFPAYHGFYLLPEFVLTALGAVFFTTTNLIEMYQIDTD